MGTPLVILGSDLRRWWGPTYDDSTGVWEDESADNEDTYNPGGGSTSPAETTTPGGYMAADFDVSVDVLWTDRLTGITYGSGQYITGVAFKMNGTYTLGDVHTLFRFKDRFVGVNAEFGSHAGKFVVGTARTNASVFDDSWHTLLAITTPGVSTEVWLDRTLQTDTSDGFSYGSDWTTFEIEIGGQLGRTRQFDGQIASPFLAYTTTSFTTGQRDDLLDWLDEVVNGASGGPDYTLDADVGTYTLTGQDAALTVSRTLAAETGSFALTGNNAALTAVMNAVAGSYSLTGSDAGLLVARRIDAEAGALALTGQDAGLVVSRRIAAEPGSFGLTGQDASLIASRLLEAETGVFALSGVDVALEYTPLGSFELDAEPGAFTLSGGDAALIVSRRLDAETGTFALAGPDVDLRRGRILAAEPGSFSLAGSDVALLVSRRIAAETGSFALTGADVAIGRLLSLVAETGAFTLAGNDAALRVARLLSAEPGEFAIVGRDVALEYSGVDTAVGLIRWTFRPATSIRIAQRQATTITTRMTMSLHVGDTNNIDGTFRNADSNALVDPSTVTIVVQSPTQALTSESSTYTYGVDALLTRTSQGLYRAAIPCTESGTWRFAWKSVGLVAPGVEPGLFDVLATV